MGPIAIVPGTTAVVGPTGAAPGTGQGWVARELGRRCKQTT